MVKRKLIKLFFSFFIVICSILMILPIILTVLNSFGIGYSNDISLTLEGYRDFFVWKPLYLKALFRSIIVSCSVMIGGLLVSIPAAYIFAKGLLRGKNILFYIYIVVMMMPFQVTLLPHYIVSRHIGTYDTLYAIILPGIFAPFSVFLLTQIIKSIPNEVLEASRMETSNIFIILLRIITPMIMPGIICAGVLVFTEQWNIVAEATILLEKTDKYPLAALLSSTDSLNPYGFVATVIFMLLPMLLYSLFESEISEGIGKYKITT